MADFNADGSPDLLLQEEAGTLAVWFMNGASLASGQVLNPPSTGDLNWQVAGAADMNADGQTDILFQNSDGTLAAWLMNGASLVEGLLLEPATPADAGWRVVGVGDFGGSSQADLVFQHSDGTLAVWLMSGTALSEAKLIEPAKAPANASVLAVTDLDRDGKADLVFQDTSGVMSVWFMDGIRQRNDKAFNPSTTHSGWSIAGP